MAQPASDNFANSVLLSGTNVTYTNNFDGATMEPGEPFNGASNTIWMSWVAPASGFLQVNKATSYQFQYYGIYTGSSVDHLQPVNMTSYGNNNYRLIVEQGTTYYFQFSGGAHNFSFNLQFLTIGSATNDNFTNAQVLKGNSLNFGPSAIADATMEPGEPLHMGDVPQKSIWWKWQAPMWGIYSFNASSSLASNVVLAVYTGDSVDALTLVAKYTNSASPLQVNVVASQTYYIAAAVPTNAIGDIKVYSGYGLPDSSVHAVPGNLLQEPSWEGTALRPLHWGKAGGVGGYVNQQFGGADGTTWPSLGKSSGVNGVVWQDFPTIPGHQYAVRFAYLTGGNLSNGSGDAQLGVSWDANLLGISVIPVNETGYWHWENYTFVATNTTSRLTFQNLARNVELDAFSVVDNSAPPVIVSQPASASGTPGGTAAFVVGVTGTSPLCYQWFYNNALLEGQTNKLLAINSLTTGQAGNYFVTITNSYGAVTSIVASLLVDTPANVTILSQPRGDTVAAGGYFNFSVVAGGTPPLTYQWFFNTDPITGFTNSSLILTNVQSANAGTYTVQVQNQNSSASSLPAALIVDGSNPGGGMIKFENKSTYGPTNLVSPVFDLDGITPLIGSNYLAQLYAGPSLDMLRPAGLPSPFQDALNAGFFVPQVITLANVLPGSNAVLQVCAWDSAFGTSYEQSRATGGKFGKSNLIRVPTGGGLKLPQPMTGLQSFSLQAGLPYFEVGTISFVQLLPPNMIVWALNGQPNSIYLIEKSNRSQDTAWHPYLVLTNITGTVNFTNTTDADAAAVMYRARILD